MKLIPSLRKALADSKTKVTRLREEVATARALADELRARAEEAERERDIRTDERNTVLGKLRASESRERELREALRELVSACEPDGTHPAHPWMRYTAALAAARAALSGSSPAPSGDANRKEEP